MKTLVSLKDTPLESTPLPATAQTVFLRDQDDRNRLDQPPEPAPEIPAPVPRRRKNRAVTLAIAVILAAMAGLGYWKQGELLGRFYQLLPYTPAIAFVVIGLIGLFYKDKDKYANPAAAWTVAICMVVFGSLMGLNTYRERDAAKTQKAKIDETLGGLSELLGQTREDNTKSGKITTRSLEKIAGDLDGFKKQVRPDELRLEMSSVRETLNKVLNPPKATLAFTFAPYFNPPPESGQEPAATKEIIRTMDEKRNVMFDITAINLSREVAASVVDLTLIICDECTFTKEPTGFSTLQGMPKNQRYMKIGLLNARTVLANVTLDVTVPPRSGAFRVGIDYRCAACVLPKTADMGIVKIANPRL